MIIFPAIDLYDGKAVRLLRGDYQNITVYSDAPLKVAQAFEAAGATHIHMVDLEGARSGDMPNLHIVEQVARNTHLSVEIGGGIRDMSAVDRCFAAGVDRVILGTAAVNDPDFLQSAVDAYGDRIAVGADVRDGRIAIRGWLEQSQLTLDEFMDRISAMGASCAICTDISRDGAMRGTNRDLYRSLSDKYDVRIVASGGVSDLEDIRALRQMNLYGAIIGKAYYTGAIDLKQAIEVAR